MESTRRKFFTTLAAMPVALSGAGSRPAQAEPLIEDTPITVGSMKFGVIQPGPRRRIFLFDHVTVELENSAPVTWVYDKLGLSLDVASPPARFTVFDCDQPAYVPAGWCL